METATLVAPPVPPAAGSNPLGGLAWAARLSARQFLQGPRKWVILLVGALLPGLMCVFVFLAKDGLVHPFLQLFDQIYLQGALVFIALLGAIPAFSADVEDGTIIYLFSRPTPRPFLVIGKWLGMIVPLAILALLPVLAAWPLALAQVQPYVETRYEMVPGQQGREERPGGEKRPPGGVESDPMQGTREVQYRTVTKEVPSQRQAATARDLGVALLAAVLGILQYGTLFFAIGVVLRWPYVLALVYGVVFEVFVGRADVNIWVLSKFIRAAALRLMEPVPRFLEGSLETAPGLGLAWAGVLAIPAAVLLASAAISTRKSYIGKGV